MGATDLSVFPQRQVVFPETTFKGVATTDVPLRVQAVSGQTGNLQEWHSDTGATLTTISSLGALQIGAGAAASYIVGGTHTGATERMYLPTVAAAQRGLVIRGVASQTGNLTVWQDPAGNNISWADSVGNFRFNRATVRGDFSSVFSINNAGEPGTPAFKIIAAASQTATLTEWQNSAGAVLGSITGLGQIKFAADQGHAIGGGFLNAAFNITSTGNYQALICRGVSGQTVNLVEFQRNDGYIMVAIDHASTVTASLTSLVLNVGNIGQRRVEVGPADSAGAGFRTVRIAN